MGFSRVARSGRSLHSCRIGAEGLHLDFGAPRPSARRNRYDARWLHVGRTPCMGMTMMTHSALKVCHSCLAQLTSSSPTWSEAEAAGLVFSSVAKSLQHDRIEISAPDAHFLRVPWSVCTRSLRYGLSGRGCSMRASSGKVALWSALRCRCRVRASRSHASGRAPTARTYGVRAYHVALRTDALVAADLGQRKAADQLPLLRTK